MSVGSLPNEAITAMRLLRGVDERRRHIGRCSLLFSQLPVGSRKVQITGADCRVSNPHGCTLQVGRTLQIMFRRKGHGEQLAGIRRCPKRSRASTVMARGCRKET